jgi:hypothetical protein
MGFTVAHGSVRGVSSITPLDIIGDQIVPVAAEF